MWVGADLALHHELRTFSVALEEIESGSLPDAPAIPETVRENAHECRRRTNTPV